MTDTVVIKGNKHGLTIILNETETFEEIKLVLGEKLSASKKFFGKAALTIAITGRTLSTVEETEIIDVIQTHSDLTITCLVDENPTINSDRSDSEESIPVKLDGNPNDVLISKRDILVKELKKEVKFKENHAVFRQGTLRSGQELQFEDSVVFIGNVHTGAKIIAKGHVVILGTLLGSVHAGFGGNYKAFVLALKMKPTQIRIGKYIGRSPDKQEDINKPRMAYVLDEQISIEDIDYSIFEELNIFKS
ncbi:MAG: septum site-determining protein MinC [Vallitaleaceae bacterium]|jgi:septum site-determining protein MinC|nr:septum site-determining protein MinC [Vallitaleaceae bacterium]